MSTKPQTNASQTKPAESAPGTDALAALEQANASLAARVGELEALLAAGAEREAQAVRDAQTWRSAQITSEAERAGAAARVDALVEQLAAAENELRRAPRAPLAVDITALVELHRVHGGDSDRYLATARRLGDALVASHAPPATR